jgi:hypothetical protein
MWRHSLRPARIFPAAGADIVKGVALGVHCWLRHAIDSLNMNTQVNQEAKQHKNTRNAITTVDNRNQWGLVFPHRPEKRFLLI